MRWKICLLLFFSLSIFVAVRSGTHTREETCDRGRPDTPSIGEYASGYRSYEEIVSTVKGWESDSSELLETGVYGRMPSGLENFYFKVSNEREAAKNRVLVTACIHGNEPWSTSTVLAYAGRLISEYGRDERVTRILDSTEIYFVPVVSPDTYPHSRLVGGLDPNRDFPSSKNPEKTSVPPVQNLRDFFLDLRPDAVLSGHTYGRVYLVPWGETRSQNPNAEDYERIASRMASMSGYSWKKTSQLYGRPIVGTESDWYHLNGSFAMVVEFGTHQKRPDKRETEAELERTFESFLFFLEESPSVNIRN